MSGQDSLLGWLTEPTPPVSVALAFTILMLGAAAAATPTVWKETRVFATWVHETSHALMAIATGRKLQAVKLNADTSGVTQHAGKETGFGRFLTAAAGYPGPALLGAAICWGIGTQRGMYALVGILFVAVLLLPVQRSFIGFAVTLMIGGVIVGVVYLKGDPAIVSYALLFIAGYLLMASPRTIVELHRSRTRALRARMPWDDTSQNHSDADTLSRLTNMPPIFWEAFFMCVSAGAVRVSVSALAG